MLPHFQQPGQEYFITWSLLDAIPPKALESYTKQLHLIQSNIAYERKNSASEQTISKLKMEYTVVRQKYLKAYDDLLHLRIPRFSTAFSDDSQRVSRFLTAFSDDSQTNSPVDLTQPSNLEIVMEALHFWDGKRIENYAFCVMSNHVHWVLRLFEKDEKDEPVYLDDILQSIKRFSANKINKNEDRSGALWQKESFDTTIRNEKHLYNAVKYTINNPVEAGLVVNWRDWKGTYLSPVFSGWV